MVSVEPLLDRIPEEWVRSLDVNTGWFPLLANLDRQLAALAPDYVIFQCKSKYGSLRFYADPSSQNSTVVAAFEGAIAAAELASTTACEECGLVGELRSIGSWLWTLCELHASTFRAASS